MTNLELYLYGVALSMFAGLVSITVTKGEECTIEHADCVLVVLLTSLFSWVMVVVQILAELRSYVKSQR